MDFIRVRLLVGKLDDEARPVVAASVDESIYEAVGEDGWDAEKVKREWPPEYEWREIIVRIPQALIAEHFKVLESVAFPERPMA